MRNDTTLGDNDITEQLVQPKMDGMSWVCTESVEMVHILFIVTDSELKMTGDDTLLLVITRGVARKLQNLGSKILEDGSQVNFRKETLSSLSVTQLEP